jgi:hypothetical protein
MSQVHQVFQKFSQDHQEDFVDGKLKVCIGGGAGFIGSHIAKALRQEVIDLLFILMQKMVL